MIKIDKSVFSAEELSTYEALIAKATVVAGAEEGRVEGNPSGTEDLDVGKSASPEMTAAMERLEKLEKSLEMKEFTEIAKKYAPLGENEEDLANNLYAMKKSNEDNYNAYIGILDKSLSLVEKSGVFSEIGKSTSGTTGGTVVDKVNSAADEILKSDANMSREQAIAKAWTDHPEWVEEYDAEYKA